MVSVNVFFSTQVFTPILRRVRFIEATTMRSCIPRWLLLTWQKATRERKAVTECHGVRLAIAVRFGDRRNLGPLLHAFVLLGAMPNTPASTNPWAQPLLLARSGLSPSCQKPSWMCQQPGGKMIWTSNAKKIWRLQNLSSLDQVLLLLSPEFMCLFTAVSLLGLGYGNSWIGIDLAEVKQSLGLRD